MGMRSLRISISACLSSCLQVSSAAYWLFGRRSERICANRSGASVSPRSLLR